MPSTACFISGYSVTQVCRRSPHLRKALFRISVFISIWTLTYRTQPYIKFIVRLTIFASWFIMSFVIGHLSITGFQASFSDPLNSPGSHANTIRKDHAFELLILLFVYYGNDNFWNESVKIAGLHGKSDAEIWGKRYMSVNAGVFTLSVMPESRLKRGVIFQCTSSGEQTLHAPAVESRHCMHQQWRADTACTSSGEQTLHAPAVESRHYY